MSTTMVLVVTLVFGFVISRVVNRIASRHFIPSGAEFLLVGIAVGPLGFGVVGDRAMADLQPFFSLLIGLVGFVIGLGLRRRLRSAADLGAGLGVGALIIVTVGAVMLGALQLLAPGAPLLSLGWLALALGCAAAVVDGSVLDLAATTLRAEGPLPGLLHSVALASTVGALCLFGFGLALARASTGAGAVGLTETEWLVASLAAGTACGVLFVLFIGADDDPQRTFLATVGVVVFASGIAAGMAISPLLVNAVAGLTVSMLSPRAARLADVLETIERPALILILLFAGAMWRLPAGAAWALPWLYLLARLAALRLARLVVQPDLGGQATPPTFGLALIPQGGVAAAVAVNFAQVEPEYSSWMLTAVLIGIIASDIAGARTIARMLADAGTVAPNADAATAERAPAPIDAAELARGAEP